MKFRFWAAVSFLTAAFLLGCSVSLEQAVVGRYRAVIDLSAVSEKEKKQAQAAAQMMSGLVLEFKEDKSVGFSMGGHTTKGTWKIEDGNIVISLPQVGSMPKFRPNDGARKLVPILDKEVSGRLAGASIWLQKE